MLTTPQSLLELTGQSKSSQLLPGCSSMSRLTWTGLTRELWLSFWLPIRSVSTQILFIFLKLSYQIPDELLRRTESPHLLPTYLRNNRAKVERLMELEKEHMLNTTSGTSCVSGTSEDGGETGAGGASVALLNSNYNKLVIARARATRALKHAEELSDSESEDSGVTTPELVAAFESIGKGDESAREEKELEEELQRQEVAKQAIIAKDQAMREKERMKELARQDMERENAERETEDI